jgi:hypothetical protein
MKNQLTILAILIFPHLVNAQRQLVWLNPNTLDLNTHAAQFDIRLTLKGVSAVNPSLFKTLINNQPTAENTTNDGTKFDNVPLSKNGFDYQNRVNLVAGTQEIVVVYRDGVGEVRSHVLRVTRSESKQTGKPNLYLLSIGTITDLSFTMKDACDFANAFRAQSEGNYPLYGKTTVLPNLLGAAATADGMRKILEQTVAQLRSEVKENDVFTLFLSSHGFRRGDRYFIVGSDLDRHNNPQASSLTFQEALDYLADLPCRKVLFIDACQNEPKDVAQNSAYGALKQLKPNLKNCAIFTSSSAGEYSNEDQTLTQGLFTHFLLEAFSGKADVGANADENGYISLNELKSYLNFHVPKFMPTQHPELIFNDLDNLDLFYSAQYRQKTENCTTGGLHTEGVFGVKITTDKGAFAPELTKTFIKFHTAKGIKADTYDESYFRRFNQVFQGKISYRIGDVKEAQMDGKMAATATCFATLNGALYRRGRKSDGTVALLFDRDVAINYQFNAAPNISESDLMKSLSKGLNRQLADETIVLRGQ